MGAGCGGLHLAKSWRGGGIIQVQDAESYQQILDRLERFEAAEAIRLGIAAAEEGRVKPAREALAELQRKLGISS